MGKKERLRRDIAGVGPEPRRIGLKPLSSLSDFRISKGEPDIRGWSVRTLNGSEVGRVDDLLVDPEAGEVVMMDVEMRASERHLQLPLRTAQLDHSTNRVIVDSGDVQRYAAMDDLPSERDRQRELDRYFEHDRDRDGVPDRTDRSDDRSQRMRDRDQDGLPDAVDPNDESHRVRDRDEAEDASRDMETRRRDSLAVPGTLDADEVVVERRPVIEEVVIRRRVVDD